MYNTNCVVYVVGLFNWHYSAMYMFLFISQAVFRKKGITLYRSVVRRLFLAIFQLKEFASYTIS